MIADAKHNENDSGTTSMRYEKISAAKTVAPEVETELTEEALLRHHAASALAAMRELLAKIQADAKFAADPREWAERYPWGSVAAAAAAGFAAAAAIAPHKKSSESADAAAVLAAERARYEAYLRTMGERSEPTAEAPPPPSASIWAPLVDMAKSAATKYLMSAAQAGIAAFAATHAATAAAEASSDEKDHDEPGQSDFPRDIRPS